MNDMTNTAGLTGESVGNDEAIAAMPALVSYWAAIKRRKLLILSIIGTFILAGLILTLLSTPYYRAVSRIEIARQAEQVTEVKAVDAIDTGKDQEFYQTQYALLKARSLAERVARSLNLARQDEFFELFGVDPAAQGSDLPSAEQRQQRLRAATRILLDHVNVAPVRGSSLVDIEFSSPDRELSARVANAWVDQFIASTLERRFASTRDARDFLQKRLAELRGRMETSERDLVNYAADKGIISLAQGVDANGKTTPDRTITSADLEALNAALASATSARIQAESALRAGAGSAARANNPALPGLRQQRAEAAGQLAQLTAKFEPAYPEVQALQSRVATLDRAIASEEGRLSGSLAVDYREALGRETALQARVAGLKQSLLGEQSNSIQYNIFQREVDTNRQLYDGLLQRFKEIGVAGVASNNVAVVDRAEVPRAPASPNLQLNLLLAALGGLLFAVLAVIALEQIDQKLKEPTDVTQRLGLPLLGVIPAVEEEEFLAGVSDPKSDIAEAYLSVQTNLTFITDHGVPRSILFTSTQPNEGKSSSVFALGQTLARTGKSVLIIDADMRNSSIHQLADIPNRAGLSNYLAGEEFGEKLLSPSGAARLSIMTAGPKPPNAGELLISPRMDDLVKLATARYDVVLIDAPPVLGIADVPLIAKTAEGVVFTVESDGARLRQIQHSLSRLRSAQAHVFGAIVTKNAASRFGYGYGYGYGYGRSEEQEVPA
jgi:polysaccharide biosynthesis transport protein